MHPLHQKTPRDRIKRLFGRIAALTQWFHRSPQAEAKRETLCASQRQSTRDLVSRISNASPQALFICDAAGRVVLANPAAERLTGRPAATIIGAEMRDFAPAERRTEVDALFAALPGSSNADTASLQHAWQTLKQADGSMKPVQLMLAPIDWSGRKMLCIHGCVRPVTQDCAVKLQAELDQALSYGLARNRVLATVSHEIRTPLNNVSGMLDLLERTPIDAEQRELLRSARSSSKLLRVLLNDLLDLSKIEAGKLELEEIPFDVQEQLGAALRPFANRAAEQGLGFSVHWNTPQRMLLGDPYRICQVINNLVDNALKFTPQGQIRVEVRTVEADADANDCELWLLVEDSGIGVAPERTHAVFDAFTQASAATTRQYGGTGLGLYLCRQICERMRGSASVRQRSGGGSVFTCIVRCQVAHGMSPFLETQPLDPALTRTLEGARVLVVDDNRVNQRLLELWLTKEQMQVYCAADGEAALRTVSERSFDVVLMDVSMPVMNGIDATSAIRALAKTGGAGQQHFASLPIIGVSAYAMKGDRETCVAAGMDDYITKPIERDVLLTKIFAALNRSATAQTEPKTA
jgi:PAS domain S-box-containing protein